MKTTLNIDDDLLHDAKRLAAERRTTLTALVEEGLRRVVVASQDPSPYELVWTVTDGGEPPQINIDDRSAVYDFLDDEWLKERPA